MLIRTLMAALATLLLAAPLRAADCPVQGGVEIADALEKASSCDSALKLFEACGYGSSMDVQFGVTVIEKCEATFLSRLSPARRKTYDREQEACTRKYIKQEGSMYRSFEAFCHAKLARAYAQRLARP